MDAEEPGAGVRPAVGGEVPPRGGADGRAVVGSGAREDVQSEARSSRAESDPASSDASPVGSPVDPPVEPEAGGGGLGSAAAVPRRSAGASAAVGEHRPVGRVPAAVRWGILGVLVAIFLTTGLYQAAHDAPTVDEGIDVSAGTTSLVRHDLRMNPEHAALPKAIAALPGLLAHPIVPETKAYREGAWFDYSGDFIAANERAGKLRPLLFWNRTVVLVEGLACAAILAALARRWFGTDGGLIVAGAWLTTPYVVGLSHVAMIDIPFTLATLAVCLALARWRERPETLRTVVLALTLGIALSTRHTALVLVAVVVAVMARQLWADARQAIQSIGVLGLISFGSLWVVYRAIAWSTPRSVAAGQLGSGTGIAKLVDAMPLPWEWRAGFVYLDQTSNDRPSSLLGHSWMGGRWWYFPVSAFLKLPLPLVLAIVVGWLVAARARRAGTARVGTDDRLGLVTVVVLPALALWAFLIVQPLNLGLRLAMPTVALAYVGLGALGPAVARMFAAGDPIRRGTETSLPAPVRTVRMPPVIRGAVLLGAAVVVVGQLGATAMAGTRSIAYTPPPWHPPYRWVSDANLDAGQAVYELRDWARGHPGAWVAYDRTRGLEVEGGSRSMTDVPPQRITGWVAVGVTPLMQTRLPELRWLHKYCPVDDLAGGAVLIYRFTTPPDPSPGPERPVAPCFGAERSH